MFSKKLKNIPYLSFFEEFSKSDVFQKVFSKTLVLKDIYQFFSKGVVEAVWHWGAQYTFCFYLG